LGTPEVIVLDTHLWVWLANESQQLTEQHRHIIEEERPDGLGVCTISCWEIAKLAEYGRLKLACPVEEWMDIALALPGIQQIELTPRIAIASTKLPGEFHRDPADQIIVATTREYGCALLTVDEKIRKYPHIKIR
jgi:PIN domain nuclease of toxin-antitoxin system